MKKYLLGVIAIVMAISFSTLSAFSEKSKKASYDPTVRFIQGGAWSTVDQTLTSAISTSHCPDGTEEECARFYDVTHLNLTSNPITIKTDQNTGQPYEPDLVLRYDQ